MDKVFGLNYDFAYLKKNFSAAQIVNIILKDIENEKKNIKQESDIEFTWNYYCVITSTYGTELYIYQQTKLNGSSDIARTAEAEKIFKKFLKENSEPEYYFEYDMMIKKVCKVNKNLDKEI